MSNPIDNPHTVIGNKTMMNVIQNVDSVVTNVMCGFGLAVGCLLVKDQLHVILRESSSCNRHGGTFIVGKLFYFVSGGIGQINMMTGFSGLYCQIPKVVTTLSMQQK